MHIKKAEIVFPEVSDRKLHVQRKITVETGKESRVKTSWEEFCEGITITVLVTVGVIIFVAIVNSTGGGQ